jgi:hypothetical protein
MTNRHYMAAVHIDRNQIGYKSFIGKFCEMDDNVKLSP